MTDVDLRAKYEQLEQERQAAVVALDASIAAIGTLRKLDQHLFDLGLQPALQLDPGPELAGMMTYDQVREAEGLPATTPPPRSRRGHRAGR